MDCWSASQHPSLVNAYLYAGGVDMQWLSMTSFLWYLYRIPSHVGSFRELDFWHSIFDKTTRDDSFDDVSHLHVDSSRKLFDIGNCQRCFQTEEQLVWIVNFGQINWLQTWDADMTVYCAWFPPHQTNYRRAAYQYLLSHVLCPTLDLPLLSIACHFLPPPFLFSSIYFVKNKSLCTNQILAR